MGTKIYLGAKEPPQLIRLLQCDDASNDRARKRTLSDSDLVTPYEDGQKGRFPIVTIWAFHPLHDPNPFYTMKKG